MNWQTPYGDPLLPVLISASLHTVCCCLLATAIASTFGSLAAVVWGSTRGVCESAIKTVVGLLDAIGPVLPPLAVLSALQVRSEWAAAVVLGTMTWNGVAAFLHDEASAMRSRQFVQAAVTIGASPSRVLFKHIVPHLAARLLPVMLSMLAGYIGLFGALGFLGIAGDAGTSLGFMVYDAKSFVRQNPAYFTGAFVSFLLIIFIPHMILVFIKKRSRLLA